MGEGGAGAPVAADTGAGRVAAVVGDEVLLASPSTHASRPPAAHSSMVGALQMKGARSRILRSCCWVFLGKRPSQAAGIPVEVDDEPMEAVLDKDLAV